MRGTDEDHCRQRILETLASYELLEDVAEALGEGATYRVARVCGDSVTGACPTDDLLWRVVKGSIQVGGVPAATEIVVDLVPVDYVAQAPVWLSHRGAAEPSLAASGAVAHLSNPRLTSLGAIVEHLRGTGWSLPEIGPCGTPEGPRPSSTPPPPSSACPARACRARPSTAS